MHFTKKIFVETKNLLSNVIIQLDAITLAYLNQIF